LETLTFREKCSYVASQSGITLLISLSLNARSVRLPAKVDTGAAFCIFQREYAEHLGIDVEGGQYQKVSTAAGHFDAYGHTVTLSCFEWEFQSVVYFAAPTDFSRNVVGRVGWLDHFRLGLIDHDSMLFLSLYDD
jgi:hypothetical protein